MGICGRADTAVRGAPTVADHQLLAALSTVVVGRYCPWTLSEKNTNSVSTHVLARYSVNCAIDATKAANGNKILKVKGQQAYCFIIETGKPQSIEMDEEGYLSIYRRLFKEQYLGLAFRIPHSHFDLLGVCSSRVCG